MKKIPLITEKELRIQDALGSLNEEYRNNLCRYKTPTVSKGKRTCHLCGLKCINRGEEYYLIPTGKYYLIPTEKYSWGRENTINVCKTCSWLTIQTINRIINEYNAQLKDTEEN